MKIFVAFILLIFAVSGFAQGNKVREKSVTWKIDNLKKIGRNKVEVLGEPKVIKTDEGKAVLFDGVDDGLIIKNNPIAGAGEFTIEAIFRPDAGGAKEQRWLHIEDEENVESRALLIAPLNQ